MQDFSQESTMSTGAVTIDPDVGGDYPTWLYDFATIAADNVSGFDAVSDADIELFHERGYLVVRNAFTPEETQSGLNGLVDLIHGKNPDFKGLMFESAVKDRLKELSNEEKMDSLRKLMWFVDYEERLKAMAEHPKLLGVLRRIIGSNDLTMFQDMGLIKPPLIGREKPWHQDLAYFNLPIDTTVVGAWIAFDSVDTENGCMMVMPGSHKAGPTVHFRRRDWQICDTHVARDAAVAVPMQPGDCLFFHGLIHHGTPANRTDRRRRAVQYHYRATDVEKMSQEYRLSFFGGEGLNVEC
ncbi:MAG: phytanoyl-CoA dioxygenase family protein [Chloroflexota bacterium]